MLEIRKEFLDLESKYNEAVEQVKQNERDAAVSTQRQEDLDKANSKVKRATEIIRSLKQDKTKLKQELTDATSKSDSVQAEIVSLKSEIDQLKQKAGEVSEAQQSGQQAKQQRLIKNLMKMRTILNNAQTVDQMKTKEVDQMRKIINDMKEQLEGIQKENTLLKDSK